MRVAQDVDAEYGYHEEFEVAFSAVHDSGAKCPAWSSVTYFGTSKFETLASAILNRYAYFNASPEGYKTVRTVVK